MELSHSIWLAVIQGLTEFLPISSSGHLILLPRLFGWPDQGLAFDVAVHLGTLLAVLVYFFDDLLQMAKDWFASWRGTHTTHSKLAWMLIWATLPVAIVGFLFDDIVELWLRHPIPIALATILFALVLWYADRYGKKIRSIDTMGWKDAMIIGCAQVLALIPGTSRSGITMTAGLIVGLQRDQAARFSFLLSIPVILLAGVWETGELLQSRVAIDHKLLWLATIISALTAWLCIHTFLRFVQYFGMLPFVLYRIALGAVILVLYSS